MSTYTETYGLIKADEDEAYDVQVFNDNFNTIDEVMAETEAELAKISEKIGSPEDSGENTVFGKLNSGGSLVKSIQMVDLSMPCNDSISTESIQPVNPDKCYVSMQYLNSFTGLYSNYTLTQNSISASAKHSNSEAVAKMRFQIIEFY